MKILTFIIAFSASCCLLFGQDRDLILTLNTKTLSTTDSITFNVTLENVSKKTFRFLPFSPNCGDSIISNFWNIDITTDNLPMADINSKVLLGNPPYFKIYKIRSGGVYNFAFCISFSKLFFNKPCNYPELSHITNCDSLQKLIFFEQDRYTNPFIGEYKITISYPAFLKFKNQMRSISSNEVKVYYK